MEKRSRCESQFQLCTTKLIKTVEHAVLQEQSAGKWYSIARMLYLGKYNQYILSLHKWEATFHKVVACRVVTKKAVPWICCRPRIYTCKQTIPYVSLFLEIFTLETLQVIIRALQGCDRFPNHILFSSALHRRYDEAKTKLKASGLGDGKKQSFALLLLATLPESTRVYRSLSESTMSIFAILFLDASVLL